MLLLLQAVWQVDFEQTHVRTLARGEALHNQSALRAEPWPVLTGRKARRQATKPVMAKAVALRSEALWK